MLCQWLDVHDCIQRQALPMAPSMFVLNSWMQSSMQWLEHRWNHWQSLTLDVRLEQLQRHALPTAVMRCR